MKPSEVAELIEYAIKYRYPTGVAFIDFDAESETLDVEWADGSADQIAVDVTHLKSGSHKWERVQG